MGMSQLHKPPLQWAGECGSMPCSVACNLAVSPPILFFIFHIPWHRWYIYGSSRQDTGEELTKCKIITITRLISPIFRSLSAENVFPPSKTAIEMMNERSNLHEIAFLPNLFCICTEIMQAFASKSSLGTGYESYST